MNNKILLPEMIGITLMIVFAIVGELILYKTPLENYTILPFVFFYLAVLCGGVGIIWTIILAKKEN